MGKHSKKRRMESSSPDEEYTLRKKLKQIQKRLHRIDERNQRNVSPHQLSPAVSTGTDSRSVSNLELESRGETGVCFDNESTVYGPLTLDPRDEQGHIPGDSTIDENHPTSAQSSGPDLNQAVLSILGYEMSPAKNITPPFQREVALSWNSILQKGLIEDERSLLMKKYTPPENCSLLKAPKVNPEVLSVTRDVVARRDGKISDLQNQIGTALSALGQGLSILLKDVDNGNNISLIQFISDASRLLLDFHQKQSKSRRELISLDLKKEVRETLSNVQVDDWLFGDKLADRLKASKEVERSGLELKPTRPKIFKKPTSVANVNKTLNFRRPSRPQGEYQGGRTQQLQNPTISRRPKPYHPSQEKKRSGRETHRFRNPRERPY